MVQVSAASIAAWTKPPDGAMLISASPGPMAAEHESLSLKCRADAAELERPVAGFREFGASEGEIGGGTGANDRPVLIQRSPLQRLAQAPSRLGSASM